MTGDASRDLAATGQFGPVRQVSPAPGFPRNGHTPARCQPGLESRDLDAADDIRFTSTELVANHSMSNEVVAIDTVVHADASANHDRPARAKRRPAWLEEFVAKITRSTGQHRSHSVSCCQAVRTSPSSLSSSYSSSTSSSSYNCRSICEVFRVPERSFRAKIMDRQSASTVTTAASTGVLRVSATAMVPWYLVGFKGPSFARRLVACGWQQRRVRRSMQLRQPTPCREIGWRLEINRRRWAKIVIQCWESDWRCRRALEQQAEDAEAWSPGD